MVDNPLCHTTTILASVSSERVIAFLRAPEEVGTWALGTWDTRPVNGHEGVYVGRSLLDGAEQSFFRVAESDSAGTIDYEVGSAAGALAKRVSIKVVPGADFGHGPDTCLITLIGWRSKDMTDDRWRRLCAFHEVEILMIEARLRGKRPPGQKETS